MISFDEAIIKIIEEKDLEDGALEASFEVSPLPKGYGHTLGNSLRRVLLSYIPGYAITSVRINDLDHEFSTIPGVLENVLDIVLRLQRIRFLVNGNLDEYTIRLTASGVKEVKAKDFDLPSEIKIVNGEHVIANLTDKSAELTIEATLTKGVGFVIAKDERRNEEPGLIPIDAVFSPVKLVNYKVLSTHKGEITNLDKLVISVVTDGSITPYEALKNALEILNKFFSTMADKVAKEQGENKAKSSAGKKIGTADKSSEKSLDNLPLSDKLRSTLEEAGYTTIEELVKAGKKGIEDIKGIGPKTVEKIIKVIKQAGYSLE